VLGLAGAAWSEVAGALRAGIPLHVPWTRLASAVGGVLVLPDRPRLALALVATTVTHGITLARHLALPSVCAANVAADSIVGATGFPARL
jgi:hypothetical protein